MVFGVSPKGFQAYAWRKGVSLTEEQAAKYLDDFFDLYPGLRAYHAKQIAFAKENGFVISKLGRIRHLPLIKSSDNFMRGRQERMSINSPIQGTLSDLFLWAVAEKDRQLGQQSSVVAAPDSGLCVARIVFRDATADRRNYAEPVRPDPTTLCIGTLSN
jgi:DNA polymerase I-like protein with 3'-5' exonuclease and polymerase domains